MDVDELYPHAHFSICFEEETLDEKLSDEKTIFIVIKHTCYCYGGAAVPNDYIQVRRRDGADFITYRDAIEAMIDYGYKPCAHYFLEDFKQIKDTIQFQAFFGS